MFPPDKLDKKAIDESMLTSYLLGVLPEDQTEQMDELSVADDEVAARLDDRENRLVDAFVRGELEERDAELFRSRYLASARRREKLVFAETLAAMIQKQNAPVRAAREVAAVHVGAPEKENGRSWLDGFRGPMLALQWALAAATVVVAVAAGYLFLENRALQQRLDATQAQQATLDAQERNLQQQLSEVRAVQPPPIVSEPKSTAHTPFDAIAAVALLLMPQTRGAGQPASIVVPPAAEIVPIQLALESDEFSHYTAVLKDPTTAKIVWTSGLLAALPGSGTKKVALAFSGRLLKQQNYVVELNGVPSSGASELVSTYTFHVSR